METIAQRPVESPTTPPEEVSGEKVEQTTSPEYTEKPLEMDNYVKDLWKVGEAAEHFKMPTLLSEINDFVLSEIKRIGLDSNRKSYEEIIQRYESRLKLPQNIDIYTKTEKVVELMKIDMKLLQAIKDKETLLAKDPSEMTSSQLKKYIQEKL